MKALERVFANFACTLVVLKEGNESLFIAKTRVRIGLSNKNPMVEIKDILIPINLTIYS